MEMEGKRSMQETTLWVGYMEMEGRLDLNIKGGNVD
jgi:hypothetical protein